MRHWRHAGAGADLDDTTCRVALVGKSNHALAEGHGICRHSGPVWPAKHWHVLVALWQVPSLLHVSTPYHGCVLSPDFVPGHCTIDESPVALLTKPQSPTPPALPLPSEEL